MKIHNLKLAEETEMMSHAVPPAADSAAASGGEMVAGGGGADRQALEIALLRARIAHLELVVETARGLLNSNQDRLLRRLHELPREVVQLMAQLQRVDPQASW